MNPSSRVRPWLRSVDRKWSDGPSKELALSKMVQAPEPDTTPVFDFYMGITSEKWVILLVLWTQERVLAKIRVGS